MKPEEAKKAADAIVLAFARIGADWQTASKATEAVMKILTTEPAAPVEKEYRAGEWMPKLGQKYWAAISIGKLAVVTWDDDEADNYRLSQGNVFPTEAITEAAKKHAEWWRAFDVADEGGGVMMWCWGDQSGVTFASNDAFVGGPRWQSKERARAWVDSHGGEAYVSEMLTKGRVFRFKWGGE